MIKTKQNQSMNYQLCCQSRNDRNGVHIELEYLISKHNIKPNSIISVCMNRNIDFIITILGILKTGSSYLPIHPDYPLERIDYIIKNIYLLKLINAD